MQFVEGHAKLGRRKKGSRNKITLSIRKVLDQAFVKSGGVNALVDWMKRSDANRLEFYKIYSKLIPLDVHLPQGSDITINANKKALEAESVTDPRDKVPSVKDTRVTDPRVKDPSKLSSEICSLTVPSVKDPSKLSFCKDPNV